MKPYHTAALALVSWYLIVPPTTVPPQSDDPPPIEMNSSAPLSQWTRWGTYDDESACANALAKGLSKVQGSNFNLPGPKNMSATNAAKSRQNIAAGARAAQCISSDDPSLQQNDNGNQSVQGDNGNQSAGDQPAQDDGGNQSMQNGPGDQPAENSSAPADSSQPQ
jgi:hypothetical protein